MQNYASSYHCHHSCELGLGDETVAVDIYLFEGSH